MKKLFLLLGTALFLQTATAQQMHVKKFNFHTFREEVKYTPALLARKSSPEAKQHAEYGVLPYNSQCKECIELIDKRTLDTRFYINPKDARHIYSQSSYLPLHYKKFQGDVWHTINPRLKPVAGQPYVYEAKNQPVPTRCDVAKKTTTLDVGELQFEFNKDLTLYFFDEETAYSPKEKGNYGNYTIGDEGLQVKNMWQGIEMRQIFRNGEIETDYVINEPLQLPITKGWLVIEDHFTLPDGYSFVEETLVTSRSSDEQYKGSYLLKNSKGETLLKYHQPVYIDALAYGMHGGYKLLRDGNNYTLQMYVPIQWLNRPGNTYPLTIDPRVIGATKIGNYRTDNGPRANMAFSDEMKYGSCNYHLEVMVPGNSILQKAYIEMEYELTYDNTCGDPPLPAPFCTFKQASMQVLSDACQKSSPRLSCNPARPPYTGTCTTDSNLAVGARPISIMDSIPDFLSCIPKQCADYRVWFTLMNRDSVCADSCGYLCARGNIWQMTVEAFRDSLSSITIKGDTLFSGFATDNQWYLNDVPISGANEPFYIVTEPGVYKLENALSDCGFEPVTINCAAHFSVYSNSAQAGHYYGFNTSVVANSNARYHWEFGDGDTSNQQYPIHDYAQPGRYNVCLTVFSGSCVSTYCDSSFYVFKTESGLMSRLTIMENPLGIKEVHSQGSVIIYPNPAKNELTIKASNFQPHTIVLYDTRGRKVAERKFTTQLDITALAPGMYFIDVKGKDTTVRKSFVKE